MMLLGCSRDDKTAYVPVKLSDKDSDEGKADITNDDKANADNSSVDNESLEDIEQGSFADDVNQIYVYLFTIIKPFSQI